jgi:molybdenum cofactor cytidylyltransferase
MDGLTAPPVPMAATILAAGEGRRLGNRPKVALQIDGTSLLERLVSELRLAGLPQVSVVIGAHSQALLPLVARCGAQALQHGRSDTSLIESQRLALQAHLDRDIGHDLLLVLADLPWLSAVDVGLLLAAWRQRAAHVQAQMPVVDGVRGHPLLLSWQAAQQIHTSPPRVGIRDWLAGHPDLVQAVTTEQRAYVTDLDTPEDLAEFKKRSLPQLVCWPDEVS